MLLLITALVGLFGSLLMFCGDMLLYFTTGDFPTDGTFSPYVNIMKKLPDWRLKLGGLLGPISAFFCCIGYGHIILITAEEYRIIAIAATLICSMGIIVGGAYHSHFTYFGLLGKSHDQKDMQVMFDNTRLLSRVSLGLLTLGVVILAVLVVLGQTRYPRWFVLLTPAVTYFLGFLWYRLPQPFKVVLWGGWYNLMFVVFYAAAALMV